MSKNAKLFTTEAMVDDFAEKFDECLLNWIVEHCPQLGLRILSALWRSGVSTVKGLLKVLR